MERERKLNWKQACVMLGCGKTKFYELVSIGKLPATRVGRRGLRVKEADILSIIEEVTPDSEEEIQ